MIGELEEGKRDQGATCSTLAPSVPPMGIQSSLE